MTPSTVSDQHREPETGVRAQLTRRLKQAGLLPRRPESYTAKVSLTLLGFVAGWAAFALVGPSWWTLGSAAFRPGRCTQVAFIGHDAGHRQVFASRRANYRLGLLLGNL